MNSKSTLATFDDCPPFSQADIDSGKLVPRRREAGKLVPVKQRVNIYLDSDVVEHFKKLADGRGYQTLINESLKQLIHQEQLEETIRRVIREEMHKQAA